ncbi:Uncharacterised protein [Enterobacter cancerogenus]|uniref:Uncharacterized protein n=1 Tax=Enterobacter cancerogenus TaxID=69218 RepID=A0A484Z8I6_9ENTR|nr:Uncharacterised protein [Enterobacter cancerogenus]
MNTVWHDYAVAIIHAMLQGLFSIFRIIYGIVQV